MKVLFCYDGSEPSERALEIGGKLLQALKLKATVLYVVPEVDERFRHYERLFEEELKEIEQLFGGEGEELQLVNQAREVLSRQGVETERKVRSGDPVEEILAEVASGGYDLVILGSHGRSALPERFLGSVSRKVSERSPASVLIVKGPRSPG